MDFTEYSQSFSSSKDALKQLTEDISKNFMNHLSDIKFSEGSKGHNFNIFSKSTINEKSISRFIKQLTTDIKAQSDMIDFFIKLSQNKNEKIDTNNDILFQKIDIDQLMKGNLNWNVKSVFNPDSSLLTCDNDGQQYIVSMKNWKIELYNFKDFIFKNIKTPIQPFKYDMAPIETEIEFPTGELIAFNFLSEKIEEYMEQFFSKSLFEFKGRDWNKFLGEFLQSANILRTPTHIGGSVFQENNTLVIGSYDTEENTNNLVGSTNNDVWQTLITDKECLLKLISVSLKLNQNESIEYLNDMLEEQSGVICNITPGKYYSYYIPQMNTGNDIDTKKIYNNIDIDNYEHIIPDMIISQNKLSLHLDNIPIIDKYEIKNFKKNLEEKYLEQNKKKDNSLTLT